LTQLKKMDSPKDFLEAAYDKLNFAEGALFRTIIGTAPILFGM